jgi:hypothetical protein
MISWPQVTFFRGGTEAPDETAQGAWLNLVAKAGFSYLMANIDYLRDGRARIVHIDEDGQRDSVTRTVFRVRPLTTPAPASPLKPGVRGRPERVTTDGGGK